MNHKKLIRTSTIPTSLSILLKGQLEYVNKYYRVIAISSAGEALEEVQAREGVAVKSINIQRQISLWKDLVSLYQLYRFFRKEKPFFVHSITPKAGLLSMVAAKLAGVPIRVHTFTGLIFPSKKGFFQFILIQMDRLLCRCATNIYPEGLGVKSDLIKYKITSKPLKVIANGNVNGINTAYFDLNLYNDGLKSSLRETLHIHPNDFVFVFIGRLVGDKGVNELIEAFCELHNEHTQIKLLLVGSLESDLDPLKKETLEKIEHTESIISAGYQADVRPYLAISDVLTFPSYREGFPNVVIQAGAMGLPSIVTDINGCNEIIEEGKNGTIIPPKNKQALKEKMRLFLTDKNYVETLHANARPMIVARYEQSTVWEALLKEYQLLEKGGENV